MSSSLRAIEADAMKLSPQERGELAELLIASIEPPAPLHPEWEAEIARRVADMDAGRTKWVDAEQALAELRRFVASRRDAKIRSTPGT